MFLKKVYIFSLCQREESIKCLGENFFLRPDLYFISLFPCDTEEKKKKRKIEKV